MNRAFPTWPGESPFVGQSVSGWPDSTSVGSGCEEKSLSENGAKPSGRSCRVGVPLGFVTCPKHIAERKCNYWAEMTMLNLWHFFGWGVGHVPKYLIVFRSDMPRNATQQKAGLVNPASCSWRRHSFNSHSNASSVFGNPRPFTHRFRATTSANFCGSRWSGLSTTATFIL